MFMGAWFLLLFLVALGFLGARAVWPAPRIWSAADPLRMAAAPALGFGIASGFFFTLRIVLHLSPAVVIACVFAALAVAGAIPGCVPAPPPPTLPRPMGLPPSGYGFFSEPGS